MDSREVTEKGLEELAAETAQSVRPGDRYFLKGSLGMGKSTFARAFIRALGVEGPIPSPTFILDSVYNTSVSGLEVHHMDLYRLGGSACEFASLGFEEILDSSAVVLIEWPERIEGYRSRRGCFIGFYEGSSPNTRRIVIEWNLAGD